MFWDNNIEKVGKVEYIKEIYDRLVFLLFKNINKNIFGLGSIKVGIFSVGMYFCKISSVVF